MNFRIALWCLAATLAQSVGWAADDGHDEVRIGRGSADGHILLGELGCIACHDAGASANRILGRQAPRLGEVGARVTPEYLRAFLARPHQVKPGTPMPDLLYDLTGEKRDAALDDLVHFLVAQGGPMKRSSAAIDPKQVERGKGLYHSVGCVACHQPFMPAPKQKIDPSARPDDDDPKVPELVEKHHVPLGRLAVKTTTEALAQFLVNPLHVRPSGRMPELDLTAEDATAIAAYLRSLPTAISPVVEPAPFNTDPEKSDRGRERFASLGCASCHDTGTFREPSPLDLSRKGTIITGFAPAGNSSPPNEGPLKAFDNNPKTKYLNFGKAGSGLLVATTGPPLVVSALELTSANDSPERDPASYLLEGSNDGKTFARIDGRAVPLFPDRYKTLSFTFDNSEAYSTYRISFPTLAGGAGANAMQIAEVRLFAAPKPLPGIASTLKVPSLDKLNPAAAGGCLSAKPSPKAPWFALSAEQRGAVRSALSELQKPAQVPTPAERIDRTMTAFNCYACHARGGKGGPEPARTGYFGYEIVVDLGDEGRLPPALNEVGAKLTAAGFDEALFSGQRYRTYMATRMPRFGRANISHLPELFAKADAGKVRPHQPAVALSMPDDGRRLVGKNALTCVSCHAWAGQRVPGAEGLDLLRATKRLRPEWFHALLVEPQKLRPRTRMPSSWPEGKSLFPKVQSGDVDKQIDAIWAYLAVGEKGLPPDGIAASGKAPFLVPGDEPIVFRTFLDGVSAHAILVGFPQRVHLAFDANRVRMALAWTGDFISPDTAWEGRGGNYSKVPSTDIVRFPDGPPFAILESQTSAWPADAPKPKFGSNRTPPGWRYIGYRYDDHQVPTFLYKAGPVTVEETPAVESKAMSAGLTRRFRLNAADEVKDFYLRVAIGKKIVEKDGAYMIDGRLTYRIKGDPKAQPVIRDVGGQQELIVPVRLGPGANGKDCEGRVEVELTW